MTTDLLRVDESRDIARADREEAAGALAHILATGDLAQLSNQQKVAIYLQQCSSLGLNAISRPFDWLLLDGRLVLYPNKSCAEQLRRQHQISIRVTRRDVIGGDTKEPMFVVEVEGRRPNGQTDQASKYVPLIDKYGKRLTGSNLANAYAKCETSAKRRLTFSMVGLAAPPDDVENARRVMVDRFGRVIESPTDEDWAVWNDDRLHRVVRGRPMYETTDPSASPLSGTASQAPTLDELEPTRAPLERQSFKPTKQQIDRWLGAWFGAVKRTSFDTDEARHQFVALYTSDWPEHLRTKSLRTLFGHCTERQAGDILARIRALAETERGDGNEVPAGVDERVHDAVLLTGGGATSEPSSEVEEPAAEPTPIGPSRPDPEVSYKRREWLGFYDAWAARMRQLDVHWQPTDVKRLPDAALREAALALVGEVDGLEASLSAFEEIEGEDDDSRQQPAF